MNSGIITEGCEDPKYTDPYVVPPLPEDECCGGEGGGGGEGHKYTFVKTATGWQVREDGKVVFTYTDVDTNTTYTWQATTEGWVVKDDKGNVLFTYKDKDTDTTYSFEKKDDCGFKVTNSKGEVVFDYDNDCAGTTYTFEQDGVNIKVTDNKTGQLVFTYNGTVDTNTTYAFEDYKKGFKVTDSNGVVAYIYDPTLGDPSDGSYPIDTLLTTVIKGHTTISTGQIVGFTPADLVVGETLVYDGVGTVGVITKDNGDGTYEVTTMTISPGSRQGVRLGSVDKEEDLPATCTAAEALGWQTPQLGDFAYVIEGEGTSEDVISEYVITNIDDDCNITWTFSHQFNAGEYQEQSTTGMSGMILTGGPVAGTFGTPIDPSTLIRGVMRNGVLLTPDAQGKVNVIVDDSHIIVNALPTTGIVDLAEYVVIDPTTLKVKSTWVHDATGWYQTYEAQVVVKSHQIVTALPTTGIEENVEYIIVDADGKHSETWVYDPTLGWVQTEVKDSPAHIVVKTLPTTGIDDKAEYVQVSDLNDPVNTYVASWVHTDKGWIKVAENSTADKAHIAVTALPTTNINENAEYLVMTNTSDPSTLTGTWVRVNGNWVQTERMEEGFHIVTSLPTSNIDDKNEYIVVEDLTKPDETLIGHYAYDKATSKWISLNSKYEVYHGVTMNGYATNADDFQDMPVGAVAPFFGTTAPAHYLLADGTVYNIGDYPELEAFIIENYGTVNKFGGNGTTTWAVPDLRGQFLRGAGTNSRANQGSGATVGADQAATQHMHTIYRDNAIVGYPNNISGTNNTQEAIPDSNITASVKGVNYVINGQIYMTGDGTQHYTSRPTNTSVNWIIKCESTYAIIPNDKYGVEAYFNTATRNGLWYVPLRSEVTQVKGNASLLVNKTLGTTTNAVAFVAPVSGFYLTTLSHPWSTQNVTNPMWMAIHKNNPNYTDANTAAAVGPYEIACNSMVDQRDGDTIATVVYLEAGDWLTPKPYTYARTNLRFAVTLVQTATDTSVSRAEMMLKPNTWPVGVEQNFGDGVYGMRWKGTTPAYTTSGNIAVRHDYQIGTLPATTRFIQTGGSAFVSKSWVWPLGSAWGSGSSQTLAYALAIYIDNDRGTANARPLSIDISNQISSTGDEYDIWALYSR